MTTFNIAQGNTSPIWQTNLQDNQGNNIDLTGASGVAVTMTRTGAATPTIDARGVTVSDPATGEVQLPFTAPDVAVWGLYKVTWTVTYAGGAIETFPNEDYDYVYVERAL